MKKVNAAVLVIDGGGRGSVLVDKYLESKYVGKVLAVPGNDLMGWGNKKKVEIFPKVKTSDLESIKRICKTFSVDLVDVAQDDAVAVGVSDALASEGFEVYGPTKGAGEIEWNKAWSREFMNKYDIPSPAFEICTSEKQGRNFLEKQKDSSWYVKASGLAAGKGALLANNNKEAFQKIYQMRSFGKAGETFLIEECLKGEEFSSFAVVGGKDFVILGHAQDHKTVYEGNLGPNTGGMGCSSPPTLINKNVEEQIKAIFAKTTRGLVEEGREYLGILYLGGIVDAKDKVWVIEFNARWGDPEAQVIIPSIKNDFYELAQNVIGGKLRKLKIIKDKICRVVVAATSRGYPADYSSVIGKEIYGLEKLKSQKDVKIYGAGVKVSGGKFFADGGRLFYVMAEGKNVLEARQRVYEKLSEVYLEGDNLHFRTDIGYRDLERFFKTHS